MAVDTEKDNFDDKLSGEELSDAGMDNGSNVPFDQSAGHKAASRGPASGHLPAPPSGEQAERSADPLPGKEVSQKLDFGEVPIHPLRL